MNAEALEHRRCAHHGEREAVARCPQCGRFFCRECIAEHAGRVLCAGCLASSEHEGRRRSAALRGLAPAIQFALGLFLIWGCFFYLGQVLMAIPAEFHEGTIWQSGWWGTS